MNSHTWDGMGWDGWVDGWLVKGVSCFSFPLVGRWIDGWDFLSIALQWEMENVCVCVCARADA